MYPSPANRAEGATGQGVTPVSGSPNPKSKIQNPKSPEDATPVSGSLNPKSKIQNPKSPEDATRASGSPNPKSKIQNPKSRAASLWRDAWRRLRKNRLAVSGLVVLVVMTIAALLTPWIAPYDYDAQDLERGASSPGVQHWLGTDQLGRDLFTRILYGGRISLLVGFSATAVSLMVGVLYGAVAGFAGGRLDSFLMRVVDILYALPYTVFVIILTVYFGRNIVLLFLAIGAVEWLTMARIVRGQVMSLAKKEFIEAAFVMGFPWGRILVRHLIPNTLGPIIVYATLTIPRVMLLEAFLSFLGLGVQAPISSWGLLIKQGVESMEEYPWLLLFPSIALSVTLFSLNFIGDGLSDALDPRSSRD